MKEIVLTRGQVALVDDEDFDRISAFRWNAAWWRGSDSFYAQSNEYVVRNGRKTQRTIIMHRYILGAPRGVHVDHVNHNTLDNRRCNIRLCTPAQNNINHGLQHNNTSGFKGVKWSNACSKWVASVQLHRSRKHLGAFESPIEAAIAYDAAARELHGEFALTNEAMGLL